MKSFQFFVCISHRHQKIPRYQTCQKKKKKHYLIKAIATNYPRLLIRILCAFPFSSHQLVSNQADRIHLAIGIQVSHRRWYLNFCNIGLFLSRGNGITIIALRLKCNNLLRHSFHFSIIINYTFGSFDWLSVKVFSPVIIIIIFLYIQLK